MPYSIKEITRQEMPEVFQEIPNPPEKLYIKGTLPSPNTLLLTVVGSRRYSTYGKEVCEKLIQELGRLAIRTDTPLAIVSGLALGIDALAHRAALEAGLPTLAIPGSGLSDEVLYPATNRGLAEKIVSSGGALLSEFEPDFRATPYAFPQRNRLMAGLSRGTLVIEATERSGTLITARLALDYNRDVFAVPGSIFSRSSEGTNRLIKEGAVPVTSGEDILSHWGIDVKDEEKESQARLLETCSPNEKRVIELLYEPKSKEVLFEELNMPVHKANVLLSEMEIKGFIKESLGEIHINI